MVLYCMLETEEPHIVVGVSGFESQSSYCERFYKICRCGSMVEQRICNAQVVSSILTTGLWELKIEKIKKSCLQF